MDAPQQVSRENMEALLIEFRKVKHDTNNTIAVFMALAELAQRDAKFCEKLTSTLASRGPTITAQLMEFQRIWTETINTGKVPAAAKAPAA
jgi:hypothetical protein